MLSASARRRLEALLLEARSMGALGPGPVDSHIEHAVAMTRLAGDAPRRFADLGSGAGVPGLVAALVWDEAEGVLIESQQRRAAGLEAAAGALQLARCVVLRARAEEVGRLPAHREQYDLVLARSFGTPATTAECGAPLVRLGGRLVVADPPEADPDRWSEVGLETLGFGPAERRREGQVSVVIIPKVASTDPKWPRRSGIPQKRPLWQASSG